MTHLGEVIWPSLCVIKLGAKIVPFEFIRDKRNLHKANKSMVKIVRAPTISRRKGKGKGDEDEV